MSILCEPLIEDALNFLGNHTRKVESSVGMVRHGIPALYGPGAVHPQQTPSDNINTGYLRLRFGSLSVEYEPNFSNRWEAPTNPFYTKLKS